MSNTHPQGDNDCPNGLRSTDNETTGGRPPRDLTSFQYNCLAVLTDGPDYGLGIKRTLQDYYGEKVNHGRLYPNLDTLVEMGLIEKAVREPDRRTNQYELSDAGWDVIEDRRAFLATDTQRAVADGGSEG